MSTMYRIALALKKDDSFIVKKDYFKDEYYYGFWEVNSQTVLNLSQFNTYRSIKEMCYASYNIKISQISFITTVENSASTYLFYLAQIDSNLLNFQEDYEAVSEEQLKNLNIIYPDAFCRDSLTGQNKSKSDREKEILIAADKLFCIRENAARADAFIALMDNSIAADEFKEYMEHRIQTYRYGLPNFGFDDNSESSLYIWKKPESKLTSKSK